MSVLCNIFIFIHCWTN